MRKPAIQVGFALLLAAVAAAEPPSPAAKAYAQGKEHLARRTSDDLRSAVKDFEEAAAADPAFAPAFAGLAETYALLYNYPQAKEAANRGLAIDERLASAHAVLGFVRLHADWDWAGAETELRRALELDPQAATPHLWTAILLEATGRSEDAVKEARRAVELQPRDPQVRAGLGYRLYWARRYDEAVTELTAAADLDPSLETAHYFIARARAQQSRFDDARVAFAKARKLAPKDPNLTSGEAYLEALAGNKKKADLSAAELERLALRGLPLNSQVAGIHAALGDKTAALGLLELAQSEHESALVWIKIDPRFDSLRGEPRFVEILRKMGLEKKAEP